MENDEENAASDPSITNSYAEMLLALQKCLTMQNVETLAELAVGHDKSFTSQLSRLTESATQFHRLKRKLEAEGKLSENNVDDIINYFEKMEHKEAVSVIRKYFPVKEEHPIPSSPEDSGDEDDSANGSSSPSVLFEDFLKEVGLEKKLSEKLTLQEATRVRDVLSGATSSDMLPFLFVMKLTSLDYRAVLPETYHEQIKSIRDFVYAFLKCSDYFLVQYIIEKLSMCQLAVPVLLPGVNGGKPTLLLWALRRIIKEWKNNESVFLEKRMINWPTFTVAFIRIGNIPLSKSLIVNNMLGRSQENTYHPYFLTKKEDNLCDVRFAKGTVEALWYTPSPEREEQILSQVVNIINLRGDVTEFPTQRKFVCDIANLVIAIFSRENKTSATEILQEIKRCSKDVLFVSLGKREKGEDKPTTKRDPKFKEGCLFYKFDNDDEGMMLSKDLCKRVNQICCRLDENDLQTYEQCVRIHATEMEIDESSSNCVDAKQVVEDFLENVNLLDFKKEHLKLQNIFLDWVKVDKRRLESEDLVENQLAEIEEEKKKLRAKQKKTGISNKMETFYRISKKNLGNKERFQFFMAYFQEGVNKIAVESIMPHLNEMSRLEKELQSLELAAKKSRKGRRKSGSIKKTDEMALITESINRESHDYSNKYIGCEHFLRELGQYFEAQFSNKAFNIASFDSLLSIAAQMLLLGHPLEVLDGDSGYVPITWISNVLDKLGQEVGNSKLFVLSIIGVQSSGKSTLLNSLFGVRFPVRAGRCTRGLFMKMIEVEESLSKRVGYKHLVIIDTEGLRSPDRTLQDDHTFDNALATLAMCLGDLTLINIQGEVLGPEMTGILQIAVHALIRMKRVNLTSHCQIIQQRISDKTAKDRNKSNMKKLHEALDKATYIAAMEEDVADKYTKFSDIFPFLPENDLQYIPCLWMGEMSPPNHFYSESISKLRQTIYSLQVGQIRPKFTMTTFAARLKDVWKAIKEEDFVFNFQNSSRALSYDRFRLHLNKLIGQLRQEILTWEIQQNGSLLKKEDHEVRFEELEAKLRRHTDDVKTKIDKYMEEHKIEDELQKHETSVKNEVDNIAVEIQNGITRRYEMAGKEQQSVEQIVEEWKANLRRIAKEKAKEFRRNVGRKQKSESKKRMKVAFDVFWDEQMTAIQKEDVRSKIPHNDIRQKCESSLIEVTKGTAISKTLTRMLSDECGKKEIEGASIKDFMRQQLPKTREGKHIQIVVDTVIKRTLATLQERSSNKSFNVNLVKMLLRKAFDELQTPEDLNVKVPRDMVSKGLLHLNGVITKTLISNQDFYESNFAVADFLKREKNNLFAEFEAFVDVSLQCETAAVRTYDSLVHICKDITIDFINVEIIGNMRKENQFLDKERLIAAILSDIGNQGHFLKYIEFVRDQENFMKDWLKEKVIQKCASDSGEWLLKMAHNKIADLLEKIQLIINKLLQTERKDIKKGSDENFCEWLDNFANEFNVIVKCYPTSLTGLKSFDVKVDISDLSNRLTSLLEKAKEEGTLVNSVGVPTTKNEKDMQSFLEQMKKAPHLEIMEQFQGCREKCPFCKVVCHLQEKGHKYHSARLHYPQGIGGCRLTDTYKLVIDMCTTSVASNNSYRFGEKETHRPFKDYRRDFPNWSITPIKDSEPTTYWKWVMARFNEDFARHYDLQPADIPREWTLIGKERALLSLREVYMAK